MMMNSPSEDTPPEGTQGTFRNIADDEERASSRRSMANRSKTRPLSQEVSSINLASLLSTVHLITLALV